MAYSIAIWSNTPDTWRSDTVLTPPKTKLCIIQDSDNKVIIFDSDSNEWIDEDVKPIIGGEVFESYGINISEINSIQNIQWEELYNDGRFSQPFKIKLFKEEEDVSQTKVNASTNENSYTKSNSYESEITDSELQKIKSISIA